jgi:protein-disulfide isomerase
VRAFYAALGVIAVVGIAAIWTARGRSSQGEPAVPLAPAALPAADFAGYVMGNDSARVEIVEYADFQCPACRVFAILTAPDVRERMVATGRVRWRFRDFPLPQHQNALAAHLAAACADEQGRFWEMHDQLFYGQSDWSEDRRAERRFREYAQAIRLDMARYGDCMENRRYAARVEAMKQRGIELGVGSTPTFIVGSLRVPGAISYDSLNILVERAAAAQP